MRRCSPARRGGGERACGRGHPVQTNPTQPSSRKDTLPHPLFPQIDCARSATETLEHFRTHAQATVPLDRRKPRGAPCEQPHPALLSHPHAAPTTVPTKTNGARPRHQNPRSCAHARSDGSPARMRTTRPTVRLPPRPLRGPRRSQRGRHYLPGESKNDPSRKKNPIEKKVSPMLGRYLR